MMRGLILYKIWCLSWLHRLRHDLGREITVFAASIVMFATFLYVFNDFLNVQVAAIALQMRAAFARTLTVAVLLLVWSVALYWLRPREGRGVERMAAQLGEDRSVLTWFLLLRSVTLIALWHGLGWYISRTWLEQWSPSATSLTEAVMLTLTILGLWAWPNWPSGRAIAPTADLKEHTNVSDWLGKRSQNQINVLTSWRLTQILRRSRISRTLFILALPFVGLVGLSAFKATPPFVALIAALAAGYLISATLCAQMADDLRHAWLERGLGVSHAAFMQSYQKAAIILGAMIGIVAAGAFLLGALLSGQSDIWTIGALTAAKAAAVAAVPAWITPCLLLQVDGRRLAVTLPVNLIVSLFVGTAVIAHWLGLALVPILINTANSSQAGRFYRA